MKIDLNKPAFAAPHSLHNDGSMNADPQEGMTVHEEAWLRFAAASMAGLRARSTTDSSEYIVSIATRDANAMIAAIEAREGEGD